MAWRKSLPGRISEKSASGEVPNQIGIESTRLAFRVRPAIAQENYTAHEITAMLLYLKDKIAEEFAQMGARVPGTRAEVSAH
jgi:hypothetical protein